LKANNPRNKATTTGYRRNNTLFTENTTFSNVEGLTNVAAIIDDDRLWFLVTFLLLFGAAKVLFVGVPALSFGVWIGREPIARRDADRLQRVVRLDNN
jgi:hypothetical protein